MVAVVVAAAVGREVASFSWGNGNEDDEGMARGGSGNRIVFLCALLGNMAVWVVAVLVRKRRGGEGRGAWRMFWVD